MVHNNCTEELIGKMISQDSRIVKLARETFKSNKAIETEAKNLIMNLERGNMNSGNGVDILGYSPRWRKRYTRAHK